MTSHTLAAIAALCVGLSVAAPRAGAAGAETPPPADASFADPLSTAWLSPAPLLPEVQEAPACRADDPALRAGRAGTAAKLARVRALLEAEAAAAPAGQVVVLGNRGYNYGGQAIVDPNLIEFEAKRHAH